MKTSVYFTLSLLLTAVLILQTSTPSQADELEAFRQNMIAHFSSLNQSQITYFVIEDNFSEISDEGRSFHQNHIDFATRILEGRANGTLSAVEQERFADLPDAHFEKIISSNKKFIDGKPTDAVYIFSKQGEQIRWDVIRLEYPEDTVVYFYDGREGVGIGSTGVHRGNLVDKAWDGLEQFYLYGAGLDLALRKRARIVEQKPETNAFVVDDNLPIRTNHLTTFVLLEEDPMYWRTCSDGTDEIPTRRIVCDDFTVIDGWRVPQTVEIQKRMIIDGERFLHPIAKMTLIDAKFNNKCEFAENLFSSDKPANIDPAWLALDEHHLNR